ncbi:hypothetical protein FPV67DRAFT_240302 [Lyophyllum atratum]|nr:hypothetical protein FPV67DRAFT_240302 [Lyophyllum atratum]
MPCPVILYYDYTITLPAEVERFWSSRTLSWGSGFFYANRYLSLFGHVPVMIQYWWDSRLSDTRDVCPALSSYHQYLAVAIQTMVGIILIMRTHALYNRNIWVLLFLCACGLAVIVFGAYSVVAGRSHKEDLVLPKIGCVPPTDRSDAKSMCLCSDGSCRRSRGGRRPLLDTLVRDGAIYFGIMMIVGLANIISFHLSPEYERGFITTFANIVSSTMMSRLMLNLRDPKLNGPYYVPDARLEEVLRVTDSTN